MAISSCGQNKPQQIITEKGEVIKVNLVDALTFKKKLKNSTLIDIRTPQEFKYGHIENAININFFDKDWMDQFAKFDKNKPIFIYCRSGNRTGSMSRKLLKNGYTQVYDLKNGIRSWKKAGLPLKK